MKIVKNTSQLLHTIQQQLRSMILLSLIAVGIATLSVSLMYGSDILEIAYAGGSGSANSDLLLINGDYYSMQVKTNPAILSGDEAHVMLTLSLMRDDSTSNNLISGVEYNLKFVDGQDSSVTLATLDAYSPEEELIIMLTPTDGEQKVSGQKIAENDVWLASVDSPAILEAPLFLEGGLVYIYATIVSIDSQPITAQSDTFEIMFSMGEYIQFTLDINDTPADLVFATYFDKIDKFAYDPQTRTVSAHMPFTWTEEYVESASFIHGEYFIPKTIDLFENHEILLSVNGMDYFGTVDRSNTDEIIIHYLLSSNKLNDLLNNNVGTDYADKLVFELRAGEKRQQQLNSDAVLESGDTISIKSTGDDNAAKYTLQLSAEPSGMLHPRNEITLSLDIATFDKINSDTTYDFELLLNNNLILSKVNQEAQDGSDNIMVTFEETGIATLQIYNIDNSDASGNFSFIISEPHDMSAMHGGSGDNMSHGSMNMSNALDNSMSSEHNMMASAMQAIIDEMDAMIQEHQEIMSEHQEMMNADRATMDVEDHNKLIQKHESVIASHEMKINEHEEILKSHESMMDDSMMIDMMPNMMMTEQHQSMLETHQTMQQEHQTMQQEHQTMRQEHQDMAMLDDDDDNNNNNGGGCLVATAAFGSELAPQVQQLRELRDNTVLGTASGTAFMSGFNQFYYTFSPAVADFERENPAFREAVQITLTPMLSSLALLNYAEINTEEEMLGYGVSIILLNVGMYVGIPAFAILQCTKLVHCARFSTVKT